MQKGSKWLPISLLLGALSLMGMLEPFLKLSALIHLLILHWRELNHQFWSIVPNVLNWLFGFHIVIPAAWAETITFAFICYLTVTKAAKLLASEEGSRLRTFAEAYAKFGLKIGPDIASEKKWKVHQHLGRIVWALGASVITNLPLSLVGLIVIGAHDLVKYGAIVFAVTPLVLGLMPAYDIFSKRETLGRLYMYNNALFLVTLILVVAILLFDSLMQNYGYLLPEINAAARQTMCESYNFDCPT